MKIQNLKKVKILLISFIFSLLSQKTVSAREVSIERESYTLFLGFNEISSSEGLNLIINQPTKIYKEDGSAYFAKTNYPCRTDTGCDGCADLGNFPLDTPGKFCEDKFSGRNPLTACGWDSGKAFFGQVIKIGEKWYMYTSPPALFESNDGLNWSFPNPFLRQYPINIKTDPDHNFRDQGHKTLPNLSNLFPTWKCFYHNFYDVRRNRIWIKDQSWHKVQPGETGGDFILEWDSPSVIFNPEETDLSKKYKMLVHSAPDYEGFKITHNEYFGLRLAYSPDGKNWREARYNEVSTCNDCPPGLLFKARKDKNKEFSDPRNLVFEGPACYFDPQADSSSLGGYYPWRCLVQSVYRKTYNGNPTIVRSVGLLYARKAEGPWHFKNPVIKINSNVNQFMGSITAPEEDRPGPQTHLARPWKYKDYTFAFFGYLDYTKDPKIGDIRLAVSLDGVNYQGINGEPLGARSFLPNGPKRYDSGNIWGVSPALIEQDEIYFYYSASPCFYYSGCDDWEYKKGGGLAKLRLDGFTHVRPTRQCSDDCYLITEPITVGNLGPGAELFVNARIPSGYNNSLKVEILNASDNQPVAGFSKAEATPIIGDSTKIKVSWGEKTNLKELQERQINQIKLKFYFSTQAANNQGKPKLFSYHFAKLSSGGLCPDGNKGNLNCDSQGLINELDLAILLDKWSPQGPVPPPSSGQASADLNNDGKVDEKDSSMLISNWKN